MPVENPLIFYPALVVFSTALSFAIATLLRWVPSKVPPTLNSIEKAFLIGGPARAAEVALFLVIREGWARHDGHGFFLSRVAEAPKELKPAERELLEFLSKSEGLTALRIRELRLSCFSEVERSLASKAMILSDLEFKLVSLLSLLPVLGALGFISEKELIRPGYAAGGIEIPLICVGALLFAIAKIKSHFWRRTRIGEKTVRDLRVAAKKRPRVRTNPRDDTYINPYDRIRDLEDDILLLGLGALAGTAFAPSSTFAVDSEKKRGAFEWGTVERAQGLPDSQNDRIEKASGT